jgi:hypothetical protein
MKTQLPNTPTPNSPSNNYVIDIEDEDDYGLQASLVISLAESTTTTTFSSVHTSTFFNFK